MSAYLWWCTWCNAHRSTLAPACRVCGETQGKETQ